MRHIGPNINFFMNVPVTSDGHLKFDDGISAPGKYVEIQAEMDLIVLISNCPQLNNLPACQPVAETGAAAAGADSCPQACPPERSPARCVVARIADRAHAPQYGSRAQLCEPVAQ